MWSPLTRKNEDVPEVKIGKPRTSRIQVGTVKTKIANFKHGSEVFPGDRLFELKATHGVPLDISISAILNKGKVISWGDFIDQARLNKVWDFQIFDLINQGLDDAGVDPDYKRNALQRVKLYMLKYPLLK